VSVQVFKLPDFGNFGDFGDRVGPSPYPSTRILKGLHDSFLGIPTDLSYPLPLPPGSTQLHPRSTQCHPRIG